MYSVQQTKEGGYILGGDSDSPVSGDKTEDSWGSSDYWIVKTDENGIKQWDKRFGGSGKEEFYSVEQTTDGGYFLAGWSASQISGDKTQTSRGLNDFWVVKTDSLGVKQWDARFGANGDEDLRAAEQTADGGYILGGISTSMGINGDKTQPNWSVGSDYWIIKIDANGVKQWDARFGGLDQDELNAIHQSSDGGYILGGWSKSGISGDKSQNSRGINDYWIVKIDANGVKQWDARFGGGEQEYLYSLEQTADKGYILGGYSFSGISDDKTEDSRGGYDYWIVKTDSSGVKQWDARFGGSGYDKLKFINRVADGGYVMAGWSESEADGDKTQGSWGLGDYWIVKTDANGEMQWDAVFGGTGQDKLHIIPQTNDGGFLLGGYTYSQVGGEITQPSQGLNDYWIVKLSPDCYALNAAFSYSNTGNIYTFSDSSLLAIQWFWDFGDGATDILQNPVHTYSAPGAYTVCLISSDSCISDTLCKQVDVFTSGNNMIDIQSISALISPNPFSGNATIEFSLLKPSAITFNIMNLDGTVIERMTENYFPAGQNEIKLINPNIASGVYLLQMRTGDTVSTIKFVVQ
jgi:hypothetical protein